MAKTAVATTKKAVTKPKTKEEPNDSFKKAKKCLEAIGENWYSFDIAVADIYTNEKFSPQYEKFAECAKQEWGMSYSTAMNHVKAGMAITKHGLSHEALKSFGISWTNFMEISSTLDPEMTKTQVESRVKKAAKMTHDEVVKFKQTIMHGTEGGHPVTVGILTFKLKNEALKVVQSGLKDAKELMGVEYDDAALEYIVVDWMNMHDPANVDTIKKQLKSDIDDEGGTEEAEPKAKPKRKERADKAKKKAEEEEEEEDEDVKEEDDDLFDDPDEVDTEDDDDDEDEEEEDEEESDDDDDLLGA